MQIIGSISGKQVAQRLLAQSAFVCEPAKDSVSIAYDRGAVRFLLGIKQDCLIWLKEVVVVLGSEPVPQKQVNRLSPRKGRRTWNYLSQVS